MLLYWYGLFQYKKFCGTGGQHLHTNLSEESDYSFELGLIVEKHLFSSIFLCFSVRILQNMWTRWMKLEGVTEKEKWSSSCALREADIALLWIFTHAAATWCWTSCQRGNGILVSSTVCTWGTTHNQKRIMDSNPIHFEHKPDALTTISTFCGVHKWY